MKINENRNLYDNSVFLGGTEEKSTWRYEIIGRLKDSIPYFNPQFCEDKSRKEECMRVCAVCLYVCEDVDTLYNMLDEIWQNAEKSIFAFLGKQIKAGIYSDEIKMHIIEIEKILERNGCTICTSLEEIIDLINDLYY